MKPALSQENDESSKDKPPHVQPKAKADGQNERFRKKLQARRLKTNVTSASNRGSHLGALNETSNHNRLALTERSNLLDASLTKGTAKHVKEVSNAYSRMRAKKQKTASTDNVGNEAAKKVSLASPNQKSSAPVIYDIPTISLVDTSSDIVTGLVGTFSLPP